MRQQLIQMGTGAHALAIQILGNVEDAEDAVHDALTKVLKNPSGYQSAKGSLRSWFLQIVRNCCLDQLRRRRPGTIDVEALVSPAAEPDTRLEKEQRDQELHAALARLSASQREIIVMRDYMDLSYAEIGLVLEIATGTVMSRLHRARLVLKKELTQHGE